MPNFVYIATSLDGYIAKSNGDINWLNDIPNPEQSDFGFSDFMDTVDALLMGRKTFDVVSSFNGPWPYSKKVFVLSNSLKEIDPKLSSKVEIVKGEITKVISLLNSKGYKNIYIDGGKTIQSLLKKNLIDELTISRVPVILGDGISLFEAQDLEIQLKHIKTEVFSNGIIKSKYIKA